MRWPRRNGSRQKLRAQERGRSRYDKLCQRVGADVGAGVMAARFEARITTKQKKDVCEGGRNREGEKEARDDEMFSGPEQSWFGRPVLNNCQLSVGSDPVRLVDAKCLPTMCCL